jgi:hypothetical protein
MKYMETNPTHSLTRSETRHMKADNPKALEVLKEIQADLLEKFSEHPLVFGITTQMIKEFKLRTTKP